MNIAEAERQFAKLIDKVYEEGITIDLERDNEIVARLTPAKPQAKMTIGKLNAFLSSLPQLGDDVEAFSTDARAIRNEFPAEASGWDS